MNATTTTELPTPPALASVSGSTAPLDESLKAFRKEQGDWRLMEHLMGWLCRLQKDSKVTKGDYAGDDFRITIKVRENLSWWLNPKTGKRIRRNKGEMLALIHSEISECLEGERKCLMDDNLPHRRMAEVELADAIIRILDYAGGFGYDLDGAFCEKMAYNKRRLDHKHAARLASGGKKF